MKFVTVLIFFMFTACTYSVTMAHTEGRANDVIDEVSTPTATVTATTPTL